MTRKEVFVVVAFVVVSIGTAILLFSSAILATLLRVRLGRDHGYLV